MANQKLDFEMFNSQYGNAVAGLQDAITSVKGIIPDIQEVARQTGSAKLTQSTDSVVNVTEQMVTAFASVEESAEEVKLAYKKIDEAAN